MGYWVSSCLVDVALDKRSNTITRWKGISWTSGGGMVAIRIEALLGLMKSMFSPYLLPQISLDQPIERIMTSVEEAQPLPGTIVLRKVVILLFRDLVVPIIDDWGYCIGLLHSEDCSELNAPLSTMMRSPPPCVSTSTSIGHVIDLMLAKRHKMAVVVKYGNLYGTGYSSSLRAVGFFTSEQLLKLITRGPQLPGPRTLCLQKLCVIALHRNVFADFGIYLSYAFPQIHLNDIITMKDCLINWI